jgi:cystathionine beta-lyase/cystathionine gamma-synthase
MKIHSKAVHAGDRKPAGPHIPVTTPVYTAASYFYRDIETIDRIFAHEQEGFAYQRYDNPTNAALEELVTELEGGHGSLACGSGMAALHVALTAALANRRKSILCAEAIYGATIRMLQNLFEPLGVETAYADVFDLKGLEQAIAERRPGCLLIETISNPLLRVADIPAIARLARAAGAAFIVDNTFATPMLVRPLELGADFSVHSATKYLAGHGDVLGGLITTGEEYFEPIRALSRSYGPVLGPFEAYLTMRGIKTFPLRFERQCANAARLAEWLKNHPAVERVYYPGDPAHPDAEVVARLLPEGLYGGMVSFEIRGADKSQVFRFINSLKMIVPATSLGDVHSMLLYPVMSSHREVPVEMREQRMGIRVNLVRLSAGIEDFDDIAADLDQALRTVC